MLLLEGEVVEAQSEGLIEQLRATTSQMKWSSKNDLLF